MSSITLALLAALFASITAILAKIGIENVNSHLATAVRTIVILLMAFIMVVSTGKTSEITMVSGTPLVFLVLSGLTTGLSWLCFFKAIQIGDVSKVVPIDKSSVVLTILLSFVVLGEPATPMVVAGGIIISIGTFILIGRNTEKKEKKPIAQSYLLLAIFSAFFAATTNILAKIGIEDIDSNVATFIRTIVILLFAWSVVFFQRTYKELKTISKKSFLFLILSGMATGLSWLCFFAAIAMGKVSIVTPIDKFSVVLTMILSFLILKEKPTKYTVVGGLLITIGTLLLIL